MKDQIYNEIRKIIAEIAEIDEESIKGNARLIEDVDIDSLTQMAIMAALELKFNIRFSLDELQEIHDLNQLVEHIKTLIEKDNKN